MLIAALREGLKSLSVVNVRLLFFSLNRLKYCKELIWTGTVKTGLASHGHSRARSRFCYRVVFYFRGEYLQGLECHCAYREINMYEFLPGPSLRCQHAPFRRPILCHYGTFWLSTLVHPQITRSSHRIDTLDQ